MHALRLIIRGLAVALAAVCVWMGLWHPAEATAVPLTPTATYAYDGHHLSSRSTYATPERGPPTSRVTGVTYFADDHRSHGSLARPDDAMTLAACDYDAIRSLVQGDSTSGTTVGAPSVGVGESCRLLSSRVAANTAIRVRPPVSVQKGQFGTKFGKHASDYGLDVGDPASRASYMAKIRDVHLRLDEVRMGQYGAYDDAFMFRQGNDLLITRSDGTFVSLYPGAQKSSWFKGAPVFPH